MYRVWSVYVTIWRKKGLLHYYYLCAINSHEMSCTDSRYTFWLFYASYLISHACLSLHSRQDLQPPSQGTAYTTPYSQLRYNPVHSALSQYRAFLSAIRWISKSKTYFFLFSFFSALQSVGIAIVISKSEFYK